MAPSTRPKAAKKPTFQGHESDTTGKSVLNKAKPTAKEQTIPTDDDEPLSDALSVRTEDLDVVEPSSCTEEVNHPPAEDSGDSTEKPAPKKKGKAATKMEAGSKVPAKQSGAANKKNGAKSGAAKQAGASTKPAAPKSKKRNAPAADSDDGGAVDEVASPKKRRAAPTVKARKVAASYDEADEADKMLWDYRHEGKSWPEIKQAWKDITGEETASSTLPNRLDRLKAAWFKLEAEHEGILLQVKKEYEAKCEAEKWAKIADIMENEHGLEKYPPKALEKTFKEISKRNTAQDQNTAN